MSPDAASLRRVPRSVAELSAPEIVRVDAICRLPPCPSPVPLAGGRSSRGTAPLPGIFGTYHAVEPRRDVPTSFGALVIRWRSLPIMEWPVNPQNPAPDTANRRWRAPGTVCWPDESWQPARTLEHRGTGRALNVRGHLVDDAVGQVHTKRRAARGDAHRHERRRRDRPHPRLPARPAKTVQHRRGARAPSPATSRPRRRRRVRAQRRRQRRYGRVARGTHVGAGGAAAMEALSVRPGRSRVGPNSQRTRPEGRRRAHARRRSSRPEGEGRANDEVPAAPRVPLRHRGRHWELQHVGRGARRPMPQAPGPPCVLLRVRIPNAVGRPREVRVPTSSGTESTSTSHSGSGGRKPSGGMVTRALMRPAIHASSTCSYTPETRPA